jgi:hypothetical protein
MKQNILTIIIEQNLEKHKFDISVWVDDKEYTLKSNTVSIPIDYDPTCTTSKTIKIEFAGKQQLIEKMYVNEISDDVSQLLAEIKSVRLDDHNLEALLLRCARYDHQQGTEDYTPYIGIDGNVEFPFFLTVIKELRPSGF